MADLLPSRPDISDDDKEPRVVGLDSDEVDDLLAAISSETARDALAALHDDPGPPSEVADRIDTSIQNAQYHLDRLETAGLIEAAGTAYSEKGREMTVYAPSDQALVVVAGPDEEATGLQSALTQLLGGVGAIALGSVVVDRLARNRRVVVITGDGEAAAAAFREHDAVNEVFTGVPPEAKAEVVDRLNGTVAMVGDGTNDAPALGVADVGISLASGTELAAEAADAVVTTDDLTVVPRVFCYNAMALPLALFGLLNPLFAALAMTASSLLVVANSARSLGES